MASCGAKVVRCSWAITPTHTHTHTCTCYLITDKSPSGYGRTVALMLAALLLMITQSEGTHWLSTSCPHPRCAVIFQSRLFVCVLYKQDVQSKAHLKQIVVA